jgi:molybdopterin-dependent oxidoreductase alpha subunit
MARDDAPLVRTNICVQTPEALVKIRTHAVPEAAAGPAGVAVAARHVFGQTGLVRGLRVLRQVNQFEGFDCPGCAWPDPDGHRSGLGEFCENGAKAVAEEATRKRIGPAFFAQWSVAELSARSDYWLGRQGRLTQPMVLEAGATHYTPIEWPAAFELIADALNELETPDDALFYTSGRTSNEAAFLYQLFVRQFGTNNLPDCSNLCHESSGTGLTETIGIGKGTVTLGDFELARLILVIGQNPGTNHPRMLQALSRSKAAGARIIHINPLPEAGLVRFKDPQKVDGWVGKGTALADQFMQVRINGDLALLKGIQKALLELEISQPGTVVPAVFVADRTEGFADFIDDLREMDWGRIELDSGISRAEIQRAAMACAETNRIIICWAMGLTQHVNGVANVQACSNLLLMRGAIGMPGAGACPVRGHSNVQGDRTMGIWERPKPAFLDALGAHFGFEPPRAHGLDAVGAIVQMAEQPGGVFFGLGGNFLSATPDTIYTASALQRCALTVQVSTKLNRSHLVTGQRALILPCLGRTERDVQASGRQFVSVENSMGVVHQSTGGLTPASPHLLSEPAIVAGLAQATLGARSAVDWAGMVANYDHIRDAISAVIPGFEAFNARVRTRGGFYLPNGAREGRFDTPSGKAQFKVLGLPDNPLAEDELLMMTVRSHDQYNTTIYGLDDRYRGVRNERRVVFVHPEDVAARGLEAGALVDLVGSADGGRRVAHTFVVVPFDVPRGNCATYFPEANVLVPVHHTARRSRTPASKSVRIRLRPAAASQPADPERVP